MQEHLGSPKVACKQKFPLSFDPPSPIPPSTIVQAFNLQGMHTHKHTRTHTDRNHSNSIEITEKQPNVKVFERSSYKYISNVITYTHTHTHKYKIAVLLQFPDPKKKEKPPVCSVMCSVQTAFDVAKFLFSFFNNYLIHTHTHTYIHTCIYICFIYVICVFLWFFSACLTNRNSKQHKIENEKQI